jgi:four helix bundle protein
MNNNKSYTDLEVWKKSRELVKQAYILTGFFPKEETYALTSQVKRAAISVPSNIAEGVARRSNRETVQFLYISRGSLYELETQFYLASDIGYLSKSQIESIIDIIEECKKLISGFINYYSGKT